MYPTTSHLQATAPAPPSLLSAARLQRLPRFLQLAGQVFAPLRALLPLTLLWEDKGLLHTLTHSPEFPPPPHFLLLCNRLSLPTYVCSWRIKTVVSPGPGHRGWHTAGIWEPQSSLTRGLTKKVRSQTDTVGAPVLPYTCCVSLGKSLHFSEPQFLHK